MAGFGALVRNNSAYRRLWVTQVVSEVGDYFNTIAVLTLALHLTGSGLAVGGVMVSRMRPTVFAGPISGVFLDRWDRKRHHDRQRSGVHCRCAGLRAHAGEPADVAVVLPERLADLRHAVLPERASCHPAAP